MKNITTRFKNFFKRHKVLSIIIALVVIGIIFIAINSRGEEAKEITAVHRADVLQQVRVTGRVEAAEKVDLAVQTGGKVSSIPAKTGKEVKEGEVLLQVSTSDLEIQLSRQRADLAKAKIALAKLAPKTTSTDDLAKAYDDGFNAVSEAFLDLPSTITGLDDILGRNYLSQNSLNIGYGNTALNYRKDAQEKFFVAKKAETDALNKYRNTTRYSDKAAIEGVIVATYDATNMLADAVKSLNILLDYISNKIDPQNQTTELTTDQQSVDTFTSDANTHISTLLEIKHRINDSKLGITDENQDVTSLQFDVDQANLDIQDTIVQIGKRTIRSPINGVVTDVAAEVGETIPSDKTVVSVISSNQYQIKADMPEADIARVSVGSEADTTLDAYGDEEVFKTKVVEINPAETIIDSVATYEVTLQFIEQDPRVRSGMTADITISGERRDNVLVIPQRAVVSKDGQKTVQVVQGDQTVEKTITTGLRGSDGNVEVLSGLNEGDQVVVSSVAK